MPSLPARTSTRSRPSSMRKERSALAMIAHCPPRLGCSLRRREGHLQRRGERPSWRRRRRTTKTARSDSWPMRRSSSVVPNWANKAWSLVSWRRSGRGRCSSNASSTTLRRCRTSISSGISSMPTCGVRGVVVALQMDRHHPPTTLSSMHPWRMCSPIGRTSRTAPDLSLTCLPFPLLTPPTQSMTRGCRLNPIFTTTAPSTILCHSHPNSIHTHLHSRHATLPTPRASSLNFTRYL
ncbi:hypothetical protein C8J57DRAFT_1297314 [Mycena rebaudengoi]|nr:hypothetical protein C8J57DRAFT_1297314 [Mycena rebaudengoi]